MLVVSIGIKKLLKTIKTKPFIMKKIIVLSIMLFAVSAITLSCRDTKKKEESKEVTMNDKYACPMDCESGKTYDKEGQCPVCEMDLTKVERE